MPQLGKLLGDGAGDDRAAEQLLAARDRQALRQQLRARRLAPLTDLGPFLHFSSLQKRPARKGGPGSRVRPRRSRSRAAQPARRRRRSRQPAPQRRSEEHTSELQSLMRISYAVFCLKKKNNKNK